jgi:hypothetical protein
LSIYISFSRHRSLNFRYLPAFPADIVLKNTKKKGGIAALLCYFSKITQPVLPNRRKNFS